MLYLFVFLLGPAKVVEGREERRGMWEGQALSELSRAFSGEEVSSPLSSVSDQAIPPLNIVMLVTGTRGDVQVAPSNSLCHLVYDIAVTD